MPNFTKKENELENRFDQWLYFFKNLETFTVIPEIFKNGVVFTEAIEKAELSRMGEDSLATYYAGLKEYRDNNSKIKTAKNEGLKEGEEIGKKKEKLEIAKNCIEDGMGIQKIAKLTCLSEEEIRGIAL
jgi:predicted transposase/invertase (TIGR01784 family)